MREGWKSASGARNLGQIAAGKVEVSESEAKIRQGESGTDGPLVPDSDDVSVRKLIRLLELRSQGRTREPKTSEASHRRRTSEGLTCDEFAAVLISCSKSSAT